jgi:hypothetical protein
MRPRATASAFPGETPNLKPATIMSQHPPTPSSSDQHRVVDLFSPGFDFERPLSQPAAHAQPAEKRPDSFVFANPLFAPPSRPDTERR